MFGGTDLSPRKRKGNWLSLLLVCNERSWYGLLYDSWTHEKLLVGQWKYIT